MIWLDSADVIFGLLSGVWLTRHYFKPVVTIKVTKLPPSEEYISVGWKEAVSPIVGQLSVASKFGNGITYNDKGAAALHRLIKDMSSRLDHAIENRWAEQPETLQADLVKKGGGIIKVKHEA